MSKVGLWRVGGEQPVRLQHGRVDLEEQLERWIEQDPELLQAGLTIVGRQVNLEGGRLDLLAIDTQGRWAVIEIKRAELRRKVMMQAMDYASCIGTMSATALRDLVEGQLRTLGRDLRELELGPDLDDLFDIESRQVTIYLVGTGQTE